MTSKRKRKTKRGRKKSPAGSGARWNQRVRTSSSVSPAIRDRRIRRRLRGRRQRRVGARAEERADVVAQPGIRLLGAELLALASLGAARLDLIGALDPARPLISSRAGRHGRRGQKREDESADDAYRSLPRCLHREPPFRSAAKPLLASRHLSQLQ